ncbi:MAG: hypothetical protein AAF634_12515, partial [Bacteroidota bacterium]
MKKRILFMLAVSLMSCSTDSPWRLTQDIGSIVIDSTETSSFEFFLPGTGTFEFMQNSTRSTKQNNLETLVRIRDNNEDIERVNFEMYLFRSTSFTAQNLDFKANVGIPKDSSFTVLATNGKVRIQEDNFHISRFSDQNDLNGSYSGLVRVFRVEATNDESDGNGDDGSNDATEPSEEDSTVEVTEDLFNVLGSIDVNNNLFLLSSEETAIFSAITGAFTTSEVNVFIGQAEKDNSSFDLTGVSEESISIGEDSSITYNLTFNDNGTAKNLTI